MWVGVIMGMGINMGNGQLDDRGRITLPKEIRDKAGLKSGDKVHISAVDNKIVIEKVVTVEVFIEELKGCIKVPGDIDPLKLKEIWGMEG
ncbi:MAG: AbrB/MazE/SpoVT family DNA-binding domain-containing protein [Candidatus Lokiarchaeota archaeon]|nr:AbrB/MazE/SpoVT family DNA-binding domain-containing protein [Candidatus Lokiarchaeota archaeon]